MVVPASARAVPLQQQKNKLKSNSSKKEEDIPFFCITYYERDFLLKLMQFRGD